MSFEVVKTNKLFIGGQFPRSESGRSELLQGPANSESPTYVCLASRKDVRMAVEAAHKGFKAWEAKTAYNRGQILYRMAEMVSSRREELKTLLVNITGIGLSKAEAQVEKSLETLIYYAGFSDKLAQVLGTVNPVSGPLSNFSSVDPVGVVALVESGEAFDFSQCIHKLAVLLCAGNAVVALLPQPGSAFIPFLGEVAQNSDLPAGVVNLLSGDMGELAPVLASHREVQALVVPANTESANLQSLGADNMKRFCAWQWQQPGLTPLAEFQEVKTLWHPMGQ